MNERPKRQVRPPKILRGFVIEDQECDENLKYKSNLVGKVNNKKISNQNNDSFYKCRKCHTKYNSRRDFVSHIRKHKGKEFLCEDCGKTLSCLQSYVDHSNIHKNLKPYRCETCGHESRQLSVHSRHLLTHEINGCQLFKCNICSKSFRLKEYLKQHMRKHIGDKPYDCERCQKRFTTKSELNRHQACHSVDRPHICQYCNRSFKLKHNLSAHIKAHTKKQCWKCSLCNASFPQQCMMEKHKKTHTEVIQHVELVKNDKGSLSITSLPLDRRKVLHYQNMSLPSNVDLNDSQNKYNSKVSLGLNDVFIPFSIIANSFGTGNYIKMKIVDKLSTTDKIGSKNPFSTSGINNAVVVEREKNEETEKELVSPTPDVKDEVEANCPQSNNLESMKEISDSWKNQLILHFDSFNKVLGDQNLDDELKLSWISKLTELIKKFKLPYDYLVSQYLHQAVTKLQSILLSRNGERIFDLHAPSCDSCDTQQSGIISKCEDLGSDSIHFKETGKEDIGEVSSKDEANIRRDTFKIQFIGSDSSENCGTRLEKGRAMFKLYSILNENLQQHLKTLFLPP